jgi:hypothetical protein
MGTRTEARQAAKQQAKPILALIDEISASLATDNERRGFLAKLHRGIYERRRPLYRHGLHPNQKT